MSTAENNEAELARRMQLPYTHELIQDDDGTWFARIAELPGCMTTGQTPGEAIENLTDALRSWVGVALEDGDVIPDPYVSREYSGRFVVRMPQSMHRDLARRAEREGVSLNQLIISELARGQGNATASTASQSTLMQREGFDYIAAIALAQLPIRSDNMIASLSTEMSRKVQLAS